MSTELLQIDLTQIIRHRLSPTANRFIPAIALRMLEKMVCQDKLNEILRNIHPNKGVEFADAALNFLNITIEIVGLKNLDTTKRNVIASNHPLGGLDGIALISALGHYFGEENIRLLVNDLLMNITPLQSVFLPINKYGSQGRHAAKCINDTYADPKKQIVIFPAGLVSRLQKNGDIKDLKWNKAFVAKSIEYNRDIVPVYFDGKNTKRFYNTARLRNRLHIPLNIEQALLPSELVKATGNHFKIIIGKPIDCQTLKKMVADGMTTTQIAEDIKRMVYNLTKQGQ